MMESKAESTKCKCLNNTFLTITYVQDEVFAASLCLKMAEWLRIELQSVCTKM